MSTSAGLLYIAALVAGNKDAFAVLIEEGIDLYANAPEAICKGSGFAKE